MKILPFDTISGFFYLKLIDDYKDCDSRQKTIIKSQQKRIRTLEWQVDALKNEIEEASEQSYDKLRKQLKRQRSVVLSDMNAISKLRDEIESLKAKNDMLEKELERQKTGES